MVDVTEFQRLWSRLLHGGTQSWESLPALAARFAGALNFSVTKRSHLTSDCGYVETRPSHPFYEQDLAVVFVVRLADGGDEDALYGAMARHVCELKLEEVPVPVLALHVPEPLRQRCAASSLKFLLIGHDEAAKVMQAERPRTQFEELVRGLVTEPTGCPFVVAGPVGGRQFFGRTDLIKRIAQQRGSGGEVMRSYAIIGPCRAGKSSLLLRLRETIEGHRAAGRSDTSATYLTLRDCDTAAKAMEAIILAVNPRLWKDWTPAEFVRQLHRPHGPTNDHVWLLDECDAAILDDVSTGQFLCRGLTGGEYNRVVLAGHTGLLRTSGSLMSDLWTSVVKETLYGLEPADAKDLFEDTFHSRHWHLRGPREVLDYVVHQTQCMPALIQLYGAATWHHVSRRGDGEVAVDDVKAAEYELVFREETVEPLMRHDDPLARLVTWVMLKQYPADLSERQIFNALKDLGVRQSLGRLSESLCGLEHVGLIRLEGGHYRFTYPVFPRLLPDVHDVGLLRDEAIAALRRG